jgi:hypothetical protein
MDKMRSQLAQVVGLNVPQSEHDGKAADGPLPHEDAVVAVKNVLQMRLEKQREDLAGASDGD